MKIKPLKPHLRQYLQRRGLEEKYTKQEKLFQTDWHQRSLKTELLEPKKFGLYSFRLDRKYRVILGLDGEVAEVVKITDHYQ